MEKYEHGGKIFAAARELNLDIANITDFSANINPFVTVEKLKEWSQGGWKKILHYPDVEYLEERSFIAAYHGVNTRDLLLGNGAASLIDLVVRGLSPQKALVTAPSFAEYRNALQKQGAEVITVPVLEDLNVDLEQFFFQAKNCDMAFLTNPNNPTGKLINKADLLFYLKALSQDSKCVLLLDEAFIDFTDEAEENSLSDQINCLDNLIILRSLTKFYGMPGLRLGYLMTINHRLLQKIKTMQSVWDVNSMSTEIAMNALKDKDFFAVSHQGIIRLREEFRKDLAAIEYKTISSQTNYFLMETKSKKVYTKLFNSGILVRDCSNFNGLTKNYFRIAVKSKSQNQRLIQALKQMNTEVIND